MSGTPQPHFLSALVSTFGGFDAAHGWGVNLFAVAALAVTGAGFLTTTTRTIRAAYMAGVVLCLTDWVLVEDLGFWGGVGTDPNSMVPMLLLLTGGYVALTWVKGTLPLTVGKPEKTATSSGAFDRPAVEPRAPLLLDVAVAPDQ
jgi:hypothetical protein